VNASWAVPEQERLENFPTPVAQDYRTKPAALKPDAPAKEEMAH